MKKALLLAAVLTAAVPAFAQDADAPPPPSDKISTLLIFGDDPCPRSSDDDIIVCARQPESERYRIPKRLRKAKPDAASRSWGDRVQALEMVSKQGLPNSCSPVGAGGQTGCFDQLLRQFREERAQRASEVSEVP